MAEESYREYVAGNLERLRRVAFLLCGDWHTADDVVSGCQGCDHTSFDGMAAWIAQRPDSVFVPVLRPDGTQVTVATAGGAPVTKEQLVRIAADPRLTLYP